MGGKKNTPSIQVPVNDMPPDSDDDDDLEDEYVSYLSIKKIYDFSYFYRYLALSNS